MHTACLQNCFENTTNRLTYIVKRDQTTAQDSEQYEIVLHGQRSDKLEELTGLLARKADIEKQLGSKLAEGESVAAARAAVLSAFDSFIADKPDYAEPLKVIFRR